MTPWGLVNCKVFGLQGPSLTNRVREIFTHGSVGGVGSNPGPYPEANAGGPRRLPVRAVWAARIAQFFRSIQKRGSLVAWSTV